MKYSEYLHVQSQLERTYDFHPDIFTELADDDRQILHENFLYDVGDDDYPASIKSFYTEKIAVNKQLQHEMLRAAQKIYDLSRSGSVIEDMKDTLSFSDED